MTTPPKFATIGYALEATMKKIETDIFVLLWNKNYPLEVIRDTFNKSDKQIMTMIYNLRRERKDVKLPKERGSFEQLDGLDLVYDVINIVT